MGFNSGFKGLTNARRREGFNTTRMRKDKPQLENFQFEISCNLYLGKVFGWREPGFSQIKNFDLKGIPLLEVININIIIIIITITN